MDIPQLENGYTRIANEILETIPKIGLNGTQYNILLVVFRYTYGFQRKNHELSLNFIAEATNSHKVLIQREVAKLIKMNILIEVSAPTFNKGRIIGFNKNHNSWELTKQLTVNQKDNHTVNQLVNTTVNQLVNQERKKENIKENAHSLFFESIWSLYPNKKGKSKISNSKKKELYKIGDELERCISRYKKYIEKQKSNGFQDLNYQYGSTFFNGGYIDYLDENVEEKKPATKVERKVVFIPKPKR
ncbi:MAG: replication protein [Acholeplasma sp.]|nr:replication protein [Acholeplasma sp.]